jgi:hypothetical protein
MPVLREMVSCYIRRFSGWTRLCDTIANCLGVRKEDILSLNEDGDPVAYIDARTQHGDFEIVVEIFVDTLRAPAFQDKTSFLKSMSRSLGEDILYDDGVSFNPYRWVLMTPDGTRFEVFEDPAAEQPDLRIDTEIPPRQLEDE